MQRGTRLLILAGVLLGTAGAYRWLAQDGPALELPDGQESGTKTQPTAAELALEPAREETVDPSLERTPVSEERLIPGGSGALLRVRVADPLGLLEHKHQLNVLADRWSYSTKYLREGDLLTARLQTIYPEPRAVSMTVGPPSSALPIAEAPTTAEADGSFSAFLDLALHLAAVDVALVCDEALLKHIHVDLSYHELNGDRFELGTQYSGVREWNVMVPVPGVLAARLHHNQALPGGDPALYRQHLMLIEQSGTQRLEVVVPTGSLLVKAAPRVDPEIGDAVLPAVRLDARNEFRMPWEDSWIQVGESGEARFVLLPPGPYVLSVRIEGTTFRSYTQREVTIGKGERVVNLDDPAPHGSLRIQFEPGAPTTIELLGVGGIGIEDELRASAEEDEVFVPELTLGVWSVLARQGDRIAFAQVDTRTNAAATIRLGPWEHLMSATLQILPSLPHGEILLRTIDAAGRSDSHHLQQPEDRNFTDLYAPGPLRIWALHVTGLIAETELRIHERGREPSSYAIPLEFRVP